MTTRRIMLDIESRSLSRRAAIIQIGAVEIYQNGDVFDHTTTRRFLCSINPASAAEYGHVNPATDDWWMERLKENERLRPVWEGTRSSLWVASEFRRWVLEVNPSEVWAKGPQFDCTALEHLFEQHELEVPWSYRAVRDLRTLQALVPIGVERRDNMAHDALCDAYYQAECLVEGLKRLRAT